LDERQPFFYICPTCKAATRGALLWDGGVGTSLELADGRVLDSEHNGMIALHINPDIPAIADAKSMMQPEGSATIFFSCLIGAERLDHFFTRSRDFRSLVKSDWLKLQRLTTYYLNRDWLHFDRIIAEYTPEQPSSVPEALRREDQFHRLLSLFFAPIWTFDERKPFVVMKASFNGIWNPNCQHSAEVSEFAKSEVASEYFTAVQRDLFEHLNRYVQLVGGLLPGLLCDMIPQEKQDEVDRLRLFRDDYEQIRDLYVQVFESCHKALRWVVGTVLCANHGTPDAFAKVSASIPGKHRTPSSIDRYTELPSAEKRKWLALIPEWNDAWDPLLDRSLRNDFGHASARHDLPTGLIQRHEGKPLAYTRMVQLAQRILQPLLACTNVMKILRIAAAIT